MSESPTALDLSGFLPYRLSVLANTVSRELAALYAKRFGITIPQWRIIAVLGQHANVSADFVGGRTAMDRVTVSRAIAGLLARKLILRRSSPSDRRCSMLRLTAAGQRVYAEIVPLARAYETRLLSRLSAADRQHLAQALTALETQVAADAAAGDLTAD